MWRLGRNMGLMRLVVMVSRIVKPLGWVFGLGRSLTEFTRMFIIIMLTLLLCARYRRLFVIRMCVLICLLLKGICRGNGPMILFLNRG